jgi:Na+/H+ antiporter NhaC
MKNTKRRFVTAIVLLGLAAIVLLSGKFPHHDGHFGLWSIVPPLLAIFLAFVTRQVIIALFIGILSGGIITGQLNVIDRFFIPAIGSHSFALILIVYLWALGGLIGLWTRTGGALEFANRIGAKLVRGRSSAKLFAWFMGIVFHQGGTISTLLTGITVRPVNDRHNVSHEELSFIVDSTASPVATIIPFNVWPIYISGLVIGTIPIFVTPHDGITFFFKSLPLNFYAIITVIITFFFAIDKLPFVPGKKMRSAIHRARTTGKLDRDDALPMTSVELTEVKVAQQYRPGLIDFLGPIGVLLGVAIVPFIVTFFFMGRKDDPLLLIAAAFGLALCTAIGIALGKGMSVATVVNAIVDGCKGVTMGAIILALAVTLKEVADAVGTAVYIVAIAGDIIVPSLLPGLLTILCMIIAFSTGTSWGTYAVVFPVAMPLAWAVLPDEFFIMLCFAAVVGGGVFGDKCSPISDTTILSSLATGCDLMDHVYTQIPLALIASGSAIILYTIIGSIAF